MATAHDLESLLLGASEDLDHRPRDDAKQGVHARRLELPRHDASAVDLRHGSNTPVGSNVVEYTTHERRFAMGDLIEVVENKAAAMP